MAEQPSYPFGLNQRQVDYILNESWPAVAVNGLLDAVRLPGDVASGQATMDDPATMDRAANFAMNFTGGGLLAERPANSLGMAGRMPTFGQHEVSSIRLRRPLDEMSATIQPTGSLEPQRIISMADLQGKTLIPAYGDRTAAGGLLSAIDEKPLAESVLLQGGRDFMREQGTGIWASMKDQIQPKAKLAKKITEAGGEPVLAYTAMSGQGGDFSTMMADAVMGQMPAAKITKSKIKEYDTEIRSRIDPEWPGIMSPKASEYLRGMTGTDRRELWQAMDKANYTDAGFPDMAATRKAITDPALLNAKTFDTGLSFGAPETQGLLMDSPAVLHDTYDSQLGGQYVGQLLDSVPGEMIWRDFFDARKAAGKYGQGSGDQRAFMMSPATRQLVDQRMVDEVSQYLEAVRTGNGA